MSKTHRITVDSLLKMADKFFEDVKAILKDRDLSRGDSYLDMELEDFATFFRDKGGRVRAVRNLAGPVREDGELDLTSEQIRELMDTCIDEAGYAVLLWMWLQWHNHLRVEGELKGKL